MSLVIETDQIRSDQIDFDFWTNSCLLTFPYTHSAILTRTDDSTVVRVVHWLKHKVLVSVHLADEISVVCPHADRAIYGNLVTMSNECRRTNRSNTTWIQSQELRPNRE